MNQACLSSEPVECCGGGEADLTMTPPRVCTPPPPSEKHHSAAAYSPDSTPSIASSDASWSPDASWPNDLDPKLNYHEILQNEELHLPPTQESRAESPVPTAIDATAAASSSPPPSPWMCTDELSFCRIAGDDDDAVVAIPFSCSGAPSSSVPLTDGCSASAAVVQEDRLAGLRSNRQRRRRDDDEHDDICDFPEMPDMSEAYTMGFQYFVSLMSSSAAATATAQQQPKDPVCPFAAKWDGHLPLAPMPLPPPEYTVQWQKPRRRQRPEMGRLSPPLVVDTTATPPAPQMFHGTTFPTTLSGHDVEILLHMDDKNKEEKIRKAPNPMQSLSIPAAQAAALKLKEEQKVKQQVHHQHVKHEAEVVAAAEVAAALPLTSNVEQVQMVPRGSPMSALKELPPLRDAPPAKKEELFIQKLQLCGVIFSFDDPTSEKRGKDMKRQTLLELVDYVNTPAGQKIFTESVMGDLMAMVSANVCRALPPATDDFDPEEDEPVLEPAWPHLQVAYEFFLRFIVSSEVNAKAAKKYVDQKFCLQLVELFDSEDPRERDYLKTILHRIYGKFMSHRSFIRRAISNVFYRFVYETERHNGIGELLEILGSIINGFAIPLKKEHLQFLVRALIPLHKPKCVALYHQQLSYCIIQYVEKDADTATPILEGFFKCWPWSCSGKQVMFLNELEEILELLGADQLAQISNTLFTNLARCLDSDHFQVVERALFLWNNEHLVNSGCLSRLNASTVLPIIYGPLYKNSSGHWNATVEGLAQNVLKMYMEYDLVLYDKCTAAYFREEEEAKRKLEAISNRWADIESGISKPAVVMAE